MQEGLGKGITIRGLEMTGVGWRLG